MQFSDTNKEAERQHDRAVRGGEGILVEGGSGSGSGSGSGGLSVSNEYDYEEVLAQIGFGKAQWLLLLISGLLTLTSISAQQSMGILVIAAQCEFAMSLSQKGIMMAACVAGIFLSTYLWGYVSDAVGRRSVLLWGTFATNLLQLISMFVTNVWVFNVINLLIGISLGGASAALYAYLSEFNTPKHRAVVINYSTMFVSVAAIYVPATAWWILSADWSIDITESFAFRPWRLIILANLLPGLIGASLLLLFPESPKLLLAQKKEQAAIDAVRWIAKFNTGKSLSSVLKTVSYTLKPELLAEDDVFDNRRGCIVFSIWQATVPLFHKPHGVHFMISAVVLFGLFFSSNGMQIWFPEIVNRSSAAATASTVCEVLDASFAQQAANATLQASVICDDHITTRTYIDNMIVGVAFLIGFSIQGTLLNPLGRKNVLLAALAIATFSGVLLHFVANSTVVLILFCLYILMPGLSISIMIGGLVDLVPTHLRGKAVSLGFSLGRLGIIVAAILIGNTLELFCNTTFAIFTVSLLICAFLVHFLPISNST